MNFEIQELLLQLSESENLIKKLDEEMQNLKNKLNNKDKIKNIKEENKNLETTHNLFKADIINYKEQIKNLIKKINENESEILKLRNVKLSIMIKGSTKPKKEDKNKNLINSIQDLKKTLNLELSNNNNDDEFDKNDINKNVPQNKNNKIKDLEKLQKKKTDYELKFIELKEKCNKFHHDIEQIKIIVENYKNYIKEINEKMNRFNEALNISVINENEDNSNNSNKKKLDDINSQSDIVSACMIGLDDINFQIKNIFGDNIEHLLNEIYNNLLKIDKHEYQDENTLKNIIDNIGRGIEEVQNICFLSEEVKNNFYNINHNVEEEVNKLKYLYNKYEKEYKRNRPNRPNNNINTNNNNSQINDNNRQINNNIDNNIRNDNEMKDSFLFGVKDINNKADMYKTRVLFNNNQENDYLEYYIEEAQLIRKKWHETCYVYDEYNIYDIYYDIKAVGLSNNQFFRSTSHGFYYDSFVQIQLFLVNGVPAKFKQRNHRVDFQIKLFNLETIKVHIIYKEIKDLSKLSRGEIEERKICRREYFGLDKSLSGQMAKFCLILKGSFDIVNFSEYFLIKNNNNKNEIEYIWGGRVPYGGKRTLIMFSKSEAVWSFKFSSKFHSDQNIRKTIFKVPIEFIGGNNEILNINASSPQTSDIILDEENREYIIRYRNINSRNAEFIIQGELQNKSKGEWLVDLSNDEIERRMPKEDVLCKPQLKVIAKKIIEDFDKNNKNKDFQFLDYMKIGMWVYNNIEYNYNFVGKTEYSAIDIYNMRMGVCHHFTKLSNALLYSLGYKVIYVSGYACKNNKEFNTDSGHAWSLINLNNKWYPFDSTWGIFSGKLPISHIFGTFFNKTRRTNGTDVIHFDSQNMMGKYIA